MTQNDYRDDDQTSGPTWYAVTYRGQAEMTVVVLADSPEEARMRAEDGQYEDASEITWVKGARYTTKVREGSGEIL